VANPYADPLIGNRGKTGGGSASKASRGQGGYSDVEWI
jgi:hypothetical protein